MSYDKVCGELGQDNFGLDSNDAKSFMLLIDVSPDQISFPQPNLIHVSPDPTHSLRPLLNLPSHPPDRL